MAKWIHKEMGLKDDKKQKKMIKKRITYVFTEKITQRMRTVFSENKRWSDKEIEEPIAIQEL